MFLLLWLLYSCSNHTYLIYTASWLNYKSNLIFEIFNSVGVEYDPTAFNWSDLEAYAYDSAKAKTHEDFVAEMARSMPIIEVIGKYVNANRRIRVQCEYFNAWGTPF